MFMDDMDDFDLSLKRCMDSEQPRRQSWGSCLNRGSPEKWLLKWYLFVCVASEVLGQCSVYWGSVLKRDVKLQLTNWAVYCVLFHIDYSHVIC